MLVESLACSTVRKCTDCKDSQDMKTPIGESGRVVFNIIETCGDPEPSTAYTSGNPYASFLLLMSWNNRLTL